MSGSHTIRAGNPDDARPIVELMGLDRRGRRGSRPRVTAALAEYPSCVAWDDGGLLGFTLCGGLAPDILELLQVRVREDRRGQGVGSELLSFLEGELADTVRALIAVNSDLYPGDGRPATGLYLRAGWALVHDTGATRVFLKSMRLG